MEIRYILKLKPENVLTQDHFDKFTHIASHYHLQSLIDLIIKLDRKQEFIDLCNEMP